MFDFLFMTGEENRNNMVEWGSLCQHKQVENSSRVTKQSPVALQTVEPLGSLPPVNICVRETTPLITARMWFLCETLQDVQIKQKDEDFLGGLSCWDCLKLLPVLGTGMRGKDFWLSFHIRSHDCLTTFQANGHCNPNKCLFQRRILQHT